MRLDVSYAELPTVLRLDTAISRMVAIIAKRPCNSTIGRHTYYVEFAARYKGILSSL